MTRVQTRPGRKLLGLAVLCAVALPTILFYAWVTWSGLEAHYLIRTRSSIAAKIETISMYKNTYYVNISFKLLHDNRETNCLVNEQLGGESLQLRVGQMIQVVPRDGCDNSVVIGRIRLPIFFLAVTILETTLLVVLARAVVRGHW